MIVYICDSTDEDSVQKTSSALQPLLLQCFGYTLYFLTEGRSSDEERVIKMRQHALFYFARMISCSRSLSTMSLIF